MEMIPQKQIRCAIYTRKSTTFGLQAEDNSLVVQREVCTAYVSSQRHRNWTVVEQHFDDGGFSGGTLERPALRELMTEVENGNIDVIVIYKIDRLTRSLTDFVRILDVLQMNGASFVSVTQTFDTSDSMGRLVLNILLTFAQFERELMSERVKDRKAAMLRNGKFAGGLPPMGYLLKDGYLVRDPDRAPLVQEIFSRYPGEKQAAITRDLKSRGITTRKWTSRAGHNRGGQPITFNTLTTVLGNPIYSGWFSYRGEWVKAAVEPLITRDQWEETQRIRIERTPQVMDPSRFLLLNILHDEFGRRMKGKIEGMGHAYGLRYYRTESAIWSRKAGPKRMMVEADRLEELTFGAIVALLGDRKRLLEAVLSRGVYSRKIGQALRRGNTAANRVRQMDRPQLRKLYVPLIRRADLFESEVSLHLSITSLVQLLNWDGCGQFALSPDASNTLDEEQLLNLRIPALMLCGRRIFSLGIKPCIEPGKPDPWLTELIVKAGEMREFMLAHRECTVRQLAQRKKISSGYFSRLLRLNYLAPDIQAAIVDGTQPSEVTRKRLLLDPLPLDWNQQRALFGFSGWDAQVALPLEVAATERCKGNVR